MCRASSIISHGLSSKPSPFPSPCEATLPPCSSSRSTLPLVASADDRAVSAASGCACGCPHLQAGAVPRRTPEKPKAIIPFGCPPTTASSEPPPPSSAASSHELPPPLTSRAPHRSGAPHQPLRHRRATTGPFSRRRLSSAQARRRGEPLSGEPLLLDVPPTGPPPRRVALAATRPHSPPASCRIWAALPLRARESPASVVGCQPMETAGPPGWARPSRPGLKANLVGPCNLGQAKAISRVAHMHSISS
jgi:hypothetical protein